MPVEYVTIITLLIIAMIYYCHYYVCRVCYYNNIINVSVLFYIIVAMIS